MVQTDFNLRPTQRHEPNYVLQTVSLGAEEKETSPESHDGETQTFKINTAVEVKNST